MTDRRDPARQIPVPGGGRATDPPLTTRACAEWMGVTTEYIRGAIKDGQLPAESVGLAGGRKMHRIHLEDFIAYLRLIGWKRIPRFPCVPGVDASIAQPTEPTQPTE